MATISSNQLGNLKTDEFEQLQGRADQLEAAWNKNEKPDLSNFLPEAGDPLRLVVLQELVKTDMECRWRRQHEVGIEYYLGLFPELNDALSPAIVFEEYRIRQRIGDQPGIDEYKARFPRFFEDLQRLAMEMSVPTRQEPAPSIRTPSSPIDQEVLKEMGGYKILERIGAGGFGEVFKAEAPGGFLKAIKVIFRPVDHVEAKREIESLELIKSMHHHFLLPTHSYWPLKERLYILMDLADGSLRDRLNHSMSNDKKPVPLPEVLRYMQQAGEALDYMHAKGIQHRDIKPENILLIEGSVRVADFGLARAQRSRLSCTGSGTPLYMPPEVWSDKTHINSDQYSLAITYFELRVGKRLFQSAGLASLMQDHLNNVPNLDPLEDDEQEVLLKALAKAPEDRFDSCGEFVQALKIALAPTLAREFPQESSGPPGLKHLTNVDTDNITLGSNRNKKGSADTERDFAEPQWKSKSMTPQVVQRSMLFPLVVVSSLAAALVMWVIANRPGPPALNVVPFDVPTSVQAGTDSKFMLVLDRQNFSDGVKVALAADPPDGIEFPKEESVPAGFQGLPVKFKVADKAHIGKRTIKVVATYGDDVTEKTEFDLAILPLATLPGKCAAGEYRPVDNAEVEAHYGKKYYKQIECVVDDKTRVKFVLVPWELTGPFYIMENKMWNGLFRKFTAQNPDAVRYSRWTMGARVKTTKKPWFEWGPDTTAVFLDFMSCLTVVPWRADSLASLSIGGLYTEQSLSVPHPIADLGVRKDELPTLRVDLGEAHLCARWFGGLLPRADQWGKAADKPNDSPFKGPTAPGEYAIDHAYEGPAPVGAALKDVSTFGCRDVAGNGLEWTRTLLFDDDKGNLEYVDINQEVGSGIRVQLRGRSYHSPWNRSGGNTVEFQLWERNLSSLGADLNYHVIGFRVVVQPGF